MEISNLYGSNSLVATLIFSLLSSTNNILLLLAVKVFNNSFSPFTQFNSGQGFNNFANGTQNTNDENYF